MKNKLYVLVLCAPALTASQPTLDAAQQEYSASEETPTLAINFTIHNNHLIKQDNTNSSSSEQTVQENGKKETVPGPLLRFMRIISEIAFR